jgi:hypothetical protein
MKTLKHWIELLRESFGMGQAIKGFSLELFFEPMVMSHANTSQLLQSMEKEP